MSYFRMNNFTLSSALSSFTSEFEMESGGTYSLFSPGKLTCLSTTSRKAKNILLFKKTTWVLYDQASRSISTGQLHTLLYFYLQPINVIVFNKPLGTFK